MLVQVAIPVSLLVIQLVIGGTAMESDTIRMQPRF